MSVPDDLDEGIKVWRRALDALLESGATHDEAVDGANLVLQAYLRGRKDVSLGGEPNRAEPDDDDTR